MEDIKKYKKAILKYLTEDFKDNQHIFDKEQGYAVYNGTDLTMVMDKVVAGLYSVKNDTQTTKLKELISKYKSKTKQLEIDIEMFDSETYKYQCGIAKINTYSKIISDLKDLIGDSE